MIDVEKFKGTFPWVDEIIKELEEARVENKIMRDLLINILKEQSIPDFEMALKNAREYCRHQSD